MPHLTLVSLSGVRVRAAELARLGATLPGLRDRVSSIEALPPLGLLTLAGLTPDRWSISLHETRTIDDDLVHSILSESPTLVAISSLTASVLEAYALSDRLRAEGVAVVLGGLHVTACSDEARTHATSIVVGDGEPVWPEVLDDAERGQLRSVYRADRPFDFRDAPLPRYDLLGRATRPRFTVQTSRGCPLACDFCGASRLLGPFRRKPVDRIAAELEAILAIDPHPQLELADDNTFAAGGSHRDLLTVLKTSGARWFTEADWRLGENPAVLERLADAGCAQVLVGFESLVHDHRGMGVKKRAQERVLRAVEAIQAAGVGVIGCFIVGSDGETAASIARLRDFLAHVPLADIQITLQTPFPGTALRDRLARDDRLLQDRDWSRYTLFDVTYQPDRMSVAELETEFRELLAATFAPDLTAMRLRRKRAIWRRPSHGNPTHTTDHRRKEVRP